MTRSPDERVLRRTAWRVGLQTAAAVAVTVAVLGAVASLVVLRSQHHAEDQLVRSAIDQADDVGDPPAGTWLVVLDGERRSATPGLPAGLPGEADLRQTAQDHLARSSDVHAGGREYRLRTEPFRDGAIQVVLDLRGEHEERERLVQALLIAGSAGLVLAALAGAWLGRRAVAPLAAALALQRRFVADAGHELRTPVTLLSTRAQLIRRRLRKGGDPAALASEADELVRDAGVLAGVLDDLLVAADPREPPADQLDLGRLADEAAGAARAEARARAVVVRTETSRAPVTGSEVSLRRAVTALLDNAIRHARREVLVHVAREGRAVVLTVTDDGPGIDESVLPTIFDRFASGPGDGGAGARRRYGLGLALVSEIVARHGGSVTAGNPAAGGARLQVRLPAARFPETTKNFPAG
ncbi:sensor histidine kinase [Amycolatopsis thermoflava]|uniref:sensor histidine kinase n=1 Tax=Amycolatopsis thermoflava TaxID=84480 RepID=UPI0038189249